MRSPCPPQPLRRELLHGCSADFHEHIGPDGDDEAGIRSPPRTRWSGTKSRPRRTRLRPCERQAVVMRTGGHSRCGSRSPSAPPRKELPGLPSRCERCSADNPPAKARSAPDKRNAAREQGPSRNTAPGNRTTAMHVGTMPGGDTATHVFCCHARGIAELEARG